MAQSTQSPKRNRLFAAALAAGVAGSVITGGVMSNTVPSYAEPVTVQAPSQNFGFADVVEKVSPAVVSVRVKEKMAQVQSSGLGDNPFENLPEDHPMRRFFESPNGPRGGQATPRNGQPRRDSKQAMAQGSGFFVSDDGYLVTNNHVVEDGENFTIVMDDGKEYEARLIGTDKRTDLAVLKVDAKNQKFAYVEFGDDSKARVGEWVVAVGNPFGLGGSVTAGIISARGRDIGAGPYDDFLQIDAAVNRGNSGGPAFDLNGKVIGVNTAIFSPSGGNVGIAFAIPASTAKTVVQSLRDKGNVQRGWLGVQIAPVTDDIAEAVGLSSDQGAIVTLPDSDTPATKAGIQTGDVITAINGETVAGPRELARKVAEYAPGVGIDVTIWRANKASNVKVTLGDLATLDESASASGQSGAPVDPSALSGYGLTLTPSDDGAGVVVTDVDPSSSAADKGVSAGDVIVSVNGKDVKTQRDVETALKDASKSGRKAALFQLRTGEQNRFVALPVAKG
ncbi:MULTISPECIES: Do family serine endopeptidase [unclassified Aureimonas]|uniref:Do family serine endopeptidase n=1 Tax=unclassified Aureimonas TaxID=2615206 RepID=UPI0006F67502|nr:MULTISPECIES: Do family serine endopeptidase [unclassified Aureimonas]KQT55283.1 serine protease [Aureimonas sp. Leaf427]KQT71075.1 serine protease [Aureimonas sp. Leaf460]